MTPRQTLQRIDDNLAVLNERVRTEPLTPVQIIELRDLIDALLDRRHRVAPTPRKQPAVVHACGRLPHTGA